MMRTPPQESPFDSQVVGLLTECQLSLVLYVRSLMPADDAANDVVQQTNARIWEKRTDFTLGSNFRAWAFAIARFEVLNYRKRQARDRLTFSEELMNTISCEIEEQDDNLLDRQEALRHCMEALKPKSRQLLMQRYAAPESLGEFANRIGRSVGGVKVSLHRLRSALGECIERKLMAEESK